SRAWPGSSAPATPAKATGQPAAASHAAVLAAEPPPLMRTPAMVSEPIASGPSCTVRMSVTTSPMTTTVTGAPSQGRGDAGRQVGVAQDDPDVHVQAAAL